MTRVLYVDCVAGVAGDMLLGALIDAGARAERIEAQLAGLDVEGLRLTVDRVERHGIGAAQVRIDAHDRQPHRNWAAVRELIDNARMPERAAARAHDAFRRLAEAEGHIHGKSPDEVHFHEVGSVDAIADVCGVAVALEDLGIDTVACSPLPAPRGFVQAAHGNLPLPAPATLELLRGAPIEGTDLDVELVTPTGAALIAALAESYGPLPAMTLEATGYGAGTRDLDERPNLVRVLIGQTTANSATRRAVLIECTLDDMSPELVPDAAQACTDAGALDVWTVPAQMKKGRPGFTLTALARPAEEQAVAEAMLCNTTSLGVRVLPAHRYELDREHRHVDVDGQRIGVKVGLLRGQVVNVAPEHDDVAHAAAELRLPAKDVYAAALARAQV